MKKVERKSGQVLLYFLLFCANRETYKTIYTHRAAVLNKINSVFLSLMHRSLRLHIHPHTFLFMHVSVVFFSLFGINLSVFCLFLPSPVIFYGLLSRILACRIDEHVWTGKDEEKCWFCHLKFIKKNASILNQFLDRFEKFIGVFYLETRDKNGKIYKLVIFCFS